MATSETTPAAQADRRIQFLRPRLLRRHISDGAERGTGTGQMFRVHRLRVKRGNLARRTASQTDLRQPKVENLGVAALGDEDVRRLDVAVDDAFGMRGIEGIGDLDSERQNQLSFHRSPCDAMLQRHPVQELHGDERLSILLANVVDGTDVWVVQRGRGLGLRVESGRVHSGHGQRLRAGI